MPEDKEISQQQQGQHGNQGNPPGQNQPQPGQQHQGQPGQKQDDKRPTHGQGNEEDEGDKQRRAS